MRQREKIAKSYNTTEPRLLASERLLSMQQRPGKDQPVASSHFKPQFYNLIHFDMPIQQCPTDLRDILCRYTDLPTLNLSKILVGPQSCRKRAMNI